jgi:hypothetical protein
LLNRVKKIDWKVHGKTWTAASAVDALLKALEQASARDLQSALTINQKVQRYRHIGHIGI